MEELGLGEGNTKKLCLLILTRLLSKQLPYLIRRFQEQKEKDRVGRRDFYGKAQSTKVSHSLVCLSNSPLFISQSDAIESSLVELRKFTDLLNACSPVACCPEFHVPSSKPSKLMDRLIANDAQPPPFTDDDDDMMHMIDDARYSTDISGPSIIQSLRSLSTEGIFTSLVRSCQHHTLLTDNNALLNSIDSTTTFKAERYDYDGGSNKLKKQYSSFSLLDDDMMDDLDQESDSGEKPDALAQVDEVKNKTK
jgi:hypothetical protein